MHVRTLIFVVAVAIALPALAADPLPRATPESVGMSSERLARIGAALRADIEKGRIPGAVVAIARKGKLVYFEAFGYLDKAAGTTMTTDAIFNIASMTKPMVPRSRRCSCTSRAAADRRSAVEILAAIRQDAGGGHEPTRQTRSSTRCRPRGRSRSRT